MCAAPSSFALSANVENLTLVAGAGAINATGNASANTLTGNESNNRLDGGGGIDTMTGGLGDDTYVVDSAAERVTEALNQGTDTVESLVSLTLVLNAENLTLVGTANLTAIGNTLANHLTGNAGNNTLDGRGGADTLEGGLGNDLYILEPTGDTIIEAGDGGTDTVQIGRTVDLTTEFDNVENVTLSVAAGLFNLTGDAANNVLRGNNSANTLSGNAGDDRLEGGAGVDTLIGGEGNDTYVLNGADIIDVDIGGNDTVEIAASYLVLRDDLENITLLGTTAFNATGNASDNLLKGNAAGNTLDGKAGADRMEGGGGNDIYFVDDTNDIVTETLNAGADLVRSTVSFALSANVENLTLVAGAGAINATGNASANTLIGNESNNLLAGLAGNDVLIGNAGSDTLDGGFGNDSMTGGTGDDLYVVDSGLDKVNESGGGGIDKVEASITYSLGANVEDLELTGTASIDAKGNTVANKLFGNSGNNTLDGFTGADDMVGGAGNDTYIVDNVGDTVFEESGVGVDMVKIGYAARGIEEIKIGAGMYAHIENITVTGAGVFNLTGDDTNNVLAGNASANILIGGVGDDVLIGQGGTDSMYGGDGDDTYYVDSIGDRVIEASMQDFEVVLVSTTSTGDQSLQPTSRPTVSGDGRIVAFESQSQDLESADPGSRTHVFVKDLESGVVTHLTVSNLPGDIHDGDSTGGQVSADGTKVAFDSFDSKLDNESFPVAGPNVFLKEIGGSLALVTKADNTDGDGFLTDLSADGQFVVFWTAAPNLKGPDGDDMQAVVVADTATGALTVVSANGPNPDPDVIGSSTNGKISADGRFVAFTSNRTDLLPGTDSNGVINDVYVRDLEVIDLALAFWLVSSSSSGIRANAASGTADVSGDGRYVLFNSLATNLVAGDTNQHSDVFVKDLQTGLTTRVSTTGTGLQGNGQSLGISISADGRYVFFRSDASNLVSNDVNGSTDLFVKDLLHGQVSLVTRSLGGAQYGAGSTLSPGALSADGRFIVFGTNASLAVDDANAGEDIYRVTNPLFQNYSNGIDEVRASITYSLGADIEKLTLLGAAALNGTGNELDNAITGNTGANTLTGGLGADTLDGGLGIDILRGGIGDDNYLVNVAADKVEEDSGQGNDIVFSSAPSYTLASNVEALVLTGTANLNGTGNADANSLTGNSGNNVLDGKAGADEMAGSAGNDTYVVDNSGDEVVEETDAGIDTVQSGLADYVLPENIENLVILGTSVTDMRSATGNALGNKLTGNAAANFLFGLDGDDFLFGGAGSDALEGGEGNDELDGQAGSDFLYGGEGDDIYYVDSQDDVAIEQGVDDTDLVRTFVTLDHLFDNVENAVLLGTAAIGVNGNDLDNFIKGNAGRNALRGGGGDDTLDGGAGVDAMRGDDGDDEYFVDSTLDQVIELEGEGEEDKIHTTVTFSSLVANVEILELLGTVALNGTGNALDNEIYGNVAGNILRGGTGDDQLFGRGGNDSLYGDLGADTLSGGLGDDLYVVDELDSVVEDLDAGTDTIHAAFTVASLAANVEKLVLQGIASLDGTGNSLNNSLTGNSGNNALTGGLGNDMLVGNAGNDVLDGQDGNDTMQGGIGHDIYHVDSGSDIVLEAVGAGTDVVHAAISYVLGANVEFLFLTGSANLNGTGNPLANTLTGNAGNNTLNGDAGNDILNGGEGDDTLIGGPGSDVISGGMGDDIYFVDNTGDRVVEIDYSHGIDSIYSTVSFFMGDLVEKLFLQGTAAIDGTGYFGNNIIVGNSGVNRLSGFDGNDYLDGGVGADFLSGNLGDDTFVYDPLDASVDGSLGFDTLRVEGSGKDLVMVGVAPFKSIEIIDITGSGDNSLYITAARVHNLSDDHRIKVVGDAGDSVRSADQGWIQGANMMENGTVYHTYAIGEVGLWVDSDVNMLIS